MKRLFLRKGSLLRVNKGVSTWSERSKGKN